MASKLNLLTLVCVLFFLFSLSKGKFGDDPIKRLEGSHKGDKVKGIHDIKLYLARFGYLEYQNTPNRTNNEFDQELESALISYQNFYHLNASGTLDATTISQMTMPRCGQPDNKTNHHHKTKLLHTVSHYQFFQGNPTWPQSKSHLTYAFGFNYPDAAVPPVDRAFNKWASASGYFTFSRVDDVTSADLKISFESVNHGDGDPFSTTTLAHAFAPTDGRFHYNAALSWSVGPGPVPNYNDLETVALHEIGHLLGLEHSEDPNAIMWSIIKTGTVKSLNDDDITGIKVLYGLN